MSLGADVADHISAPGLLKNSPSAQLFKHELIIEGILLDKNKTIIVIKYKN